MAERGLKKPTDAVRDGDRELSPRLGFVAQSLIGIMLSIGCLLVVGILALLGAGQHLIFWVAVFFAIWSVVFFGLRKGYYTTISVAILMVLAEYVIITSLLNWMEIHR